MFIGHFSGGSLHSQSNHLTGGGTDKQFSTGKYTN